MRPVPCVTFLVLPPTTHNTSPTRRRIEQEPALDSYPDHVSGSEYDLSAKPRPQLLGVLEAQPGNTGQIPDLQALCVCSELVTALALALCSFSVSFLPRITLLPSSRTQGLETKTQTAKQARRVAMSFEKDSSFCVPLWIDGAHLRPDDSPTYAVTTPPAHELAWTACAATPATITQAVSAASKALKSWSKTPLPARVAIFSKAAELLESQASSNEVDFYIQKELGCPNAWATFNREFSLDAFRGIGDVLEDALRSEKIVGKDGMRGLVTRAPYGVVGAIAPWNGPLILGLRALLAPIAAGNTVVMLASPQSPMTHHFLGPLLHSAGLPSGVLNILPAPPSPDKAAEVVEALLANPTLRHLNFTGSTAVGRKINEVAGRYGKPVTMELGGKSVALALKDANLDTLAHEIVVGAYANSGQICMSTELAIVPSSIVSALIPKLVARIPQIFPHPLPLITTASKQRLVKLLTDATSKGASVHSATGQLVNLADVTADPSSSATPALFLTGVTKQMEIYGTETFAPVFCLLEYDGENVEEGIKLTNDVEYGLSVAVFSANEDEALRVAEEIESGAVHVNHMTVYDNASFPHGGYKASGYGRFGGKWGIREFTFIKTITTSSQASRMTFE
ncbi:Vanillyl-alcohol oxidase [Drechslerella dactyloides]|uniref:Vanillyl-alcohol oxidase n=1 Tax=Drechslerella dactyloides TaxID=74499 RepID=A0AAD6J0B6_DREDA|nr:Vanillyl-alcohol oxidase [Drechslerella dactyloides]